MVTMNQGIREVRDTGSRFIHRMESSMVAVYDWVSGPPMSEQDRNQHKLLETEHIRRFTQLTV